jgi:hypothetical protein
MRSLLYLLTHPVERSIDVYGRGQVLVVRVLVWMGVDYLPIKESGHRLSTKRALRNLFTNPQMVRF